MKHQSVAASEVLQYIVCLNLLSILLNLKLWGKMHLPGEKQII